MHATSKREAGGALIMVLIVLTLLTIVGLLALETVGLERESAAAELGATRAMYIAEAGIQWALQEIDQTYNIDPGNPDYSAITTLPTVAADAEWGPSQIVGWHQLHVDPFKNFGGGAYRVVAKPANPPEADTLLVRCLARFGTGSNIARRMLEVAVAPN